MTPTSRPATPHDLELLVSLYRELESEQTAIKTMWPLADGLAEPIDASLVSLLDDPESLVVIGSIDDVPLGFAWGRSDPLLIQAGNDRVASIRLIFTDHDARGVGVGHAMVSQLLDHFRAMGIRLFDSYVSPGHRLAKNFFEAHGFSARLIVMHHDDDRE